MHIATDMDSAPQTDLSSTDMTRRLARQALAFDDRAVPADVEEIARHCLLDWFSVSLAAWDSPQLRALQAWVGLEPAPGVATLLGSGQRVAASQAALINGTASHLLDFDDAHLPSRVHPSAPLWPAILAMAQTHGGSGAQALAAFAAGVQVQSRLGAVMGNSHYRDGWHNTATLGTFGATAAAGRLLGLDEDALCRAFGFAATLSAGMRSVFGSPAKPLHAGRAAATGMMAAGLVHRGMETFGDILERPEGYVQTYASTFDPARIDAPADLWEVRRIVFKYHASCYGTQAPIEAALALRGRMDRAGCERIDVHVEPQYMDVCNIARPTTTSEAKFSVAHMVALALAGRDTSNEENLSGSALTDGDVIAWRDLIHVHGDPQVARANARVTIAGSNGRLENTHDASLPQSDLRIQRRRLLEKSSLLLNPRYGESRVTEAQAGLLAIGSQDALGDWLQDIVLRMVDDK
ncbi:MULTISPECIES: MmgE/PrpD family protein [unclassified Achromobacter]|uniref:MmgE/PrpD family protein n=1 Tax=unclassified Achromobacter TaxID=2626865 RepID=UPI000B51DC97|nr:MULTISPECIES: MmgE/PrpD family protein [unclassified Achromobacter]OWT73750.1 MmgE/PrpD family protein [Achromobacter sp. HZ34]OWT79334.1 MmgE/PrpD family protein [Achromobacter sp. HZ28]